MTTAAGRKLIHIPILHSSADMGSLSQRLKKEYASRYGARKWQEHVQQIERFWDSVTRRVLALPLAFQRVKLYQDGLPDCGQELEIARETAAKGSKNYQLLVSLVGRGATLMGTEDPQLLLEEYQRLQTTLEGTGQVDAQAEAELLHKRDAYIAQRIADTLGEGETGLLFLGAFHQVRKLLPEDMAVTSLSSS